MSENKIEKKDNKPAPKTGEKAELNEKDLDNVVGGRTPAGGTVTGTNIPTL